MNGFLMPVFDQIDFVCDLIKNDPELKDGYHAVGFRKVENCLILNLYINFMTTDFDDVQLKSVRVRNFCEV